MSSRLSADSVSSLTSAFSSLYAMLLVCAYATLSFTELVVSDPDRTHPGEHDLFLEGGTGFFVYCYVVSIAFLLYAIVSALRGKKVDENDRSHGSVAMRFGALAFGAGASCYFVLELISFLEVPSSDATCFHPSLGVNAALALIFVALQTFLVFFYPRLNLRVSPVLDRFGLIHLVAVNIIVWIRTVVKESLHEISEFVEEHESKVGEQHEVGGGEYEGLLEAVDRAAANATARKHEGCVVLSDRVTEYEHQHVECLRLHNELLGDLLLKSSPYLYPFVIEYAVIGASVAVVMWRHVGKSSREREDGGGAGGLHRPNPKEFLHKNDFWGHSAVGLALGVLAMAMAALELGLFFGLDKERTAEDDLVAELTSKTINVVANSLALVLAAIGLFQIQKLNQRKDSERIPIATEELDLSLLRLSAFFCYAYLCFTVITGAFGHDLVVEDFHNALHVVNGAVVIAQVTVQIVFFVDLKKKILPHDERNSMPGRQVTAFLVFFNLAQWIVFTFEIQKVRASVVEAAFYGLTPWVLIQRVTLPLAAFFRFHSTVVAMDLWKDTYNSHHHHQHEAAHDGKAVH